MVFFHRPFTVNCLSALPKWSRTIVSHDVYSPNVFEVGRYNMYDNFNNSKNREKSFFSWKFFNCRSLSISHTWYVSTEFVSIDNIILTFYWKVSIYEYKYIRYDYIISTYNSIYWNTRITVYVFLFSWELRKKVKKIKFNLFIYTMCLMKLYPFRFEILYGTTCLWKIIGARFFSGRNVLLYVLIVSY